MQRQIQALHLLLLGEKLLIGWRRTTFSRFEGAARLSENVPYIGPDDGDIVLSGCGTLGEKEEDIVLEKCEHCKWMKFLIVLHHDGTM
jgi:hypothetical protein